MSEIVTLGIDGMTCAACVSRVERALQRVPGVQAAVVSLATERAEIQIAAADAAMREQLAAAVAKAGYSARSVDPLAAAREPVESRDAWRVLAAAILASPLVAEMLGHFGWVDFHLEPLLALALATPVQFVLGAPFYRAAWKAVRAGSGTMDLLVVLGTTAAYAASAVAVLRDPFGHVTHYFEAAAVVIALVLLGRLLEQRARRSAVRAIHALVALAPERALVRRAGGEIEIAARDVVVGDVVVAKPGMRFAVDGRVLEGESTADEALITGESRPVEKRPGDLVIGGAVNGEGALLVEATAIGAQSTLARIVRLVERAQGSKAPVQRLVDRVAAIFVPVVLAIAVSAFLVWWLWLGDAAGGLVAAVSVLVIACPCALGLATPMAIVAGCGVAARHAILIKDAAALERLALVDAVVFDKTGTLTEGRPSVVRVASAPGFGERQVIALAAAVERSSAHPLARALLARAEEIGIPPATPVLVESLAGRGLKGRVDGALVLVGTAALMREAGIALDALAPAIAALDDEGLTRAFVARDGMLVGVVGLGDRLRADAESALRRLRDRRIHVVMATGDAQSTAARVASGLAIDEVIAEAAPDMKLAVVERLRKAGRVVAVVGDGVNDAPALAAADIGIAVGGGADAALETAGVAILRGDIGQVAEAIALSRATRSRIRENLFWASIFNLLGLPAAAAGLLNPMLAGAAMAFSSLAVGLNSLRLMRWRPPPAL
ncbi:MAG: copper-translocating P-type ATPase [Alphaproteobacteria bacterium]|nr:copper-translocating P-type ATPase [Alphaproteobacteria bacterium]